MFRIFSPIKRIKTFKLQGKLGGVEKMLKFGKGVLTTREHRSFQYSKDIIETGFITVKQVKQHKLEY